MDLFSHLSAGGHLGVCRILTFMSQAALNICVQVFVWGLFSVHFDTSLRMIACAANVHLTLWGSVTLCSKLLYYFTFPPVMCKGSSSSTSVEYITLHQCSTLTVLLKSWWMLFQWVWSHISPWIGFAWPWWLMVTYLYFILFYVQDSVMWPSAYSWTPPLMGNWLPSR